MTSCAGARPGDGRGNRGDGGGRRGGRARVRVPGHSQQPYTWQLCCQLADVRADRGVELIATTGESVLEIGLQPAGKFVEDFRPGNGGWPSWMTARRAGESRARRRAAGRASRDVLRPRYGLERHLGRGRGGSAARDQVDGFLGTPDDSARDADPVQGSEGDAGDSARLRAARARTRCRRRERTARTFAGPDRESPGGWGPQGFRRTRPTSQSDCVASR
jgi:hypothetical protein